MENALTREELEQLRQPIPDHRFGTSVDYWWNAKSRVLTALERALAEPARIEAAREEAAQEVHAAHIRQYDRIRTVMGINLSEGPQDWRHMPARDIDGTALRDAYDTLVVLVGKKIEKVREEGEARGYARGLEDAEEMASRAPYKDDPEEHTEAICDEIRSLTWTPWAPTHRHYKGGLYREIERLPDRSDDNARPDGIVVYEGERRDRHSIDARRWEGVVPAYSLDGKTSSTGEYVRRYAPINESTAEPIMQELHNAPEPTAPTTLDPIDYNDLRRRFFRYLAPVTRKAILTHLLGLDEKVMAQVQTHNDEDRLFVQAVDLGYAAAIEKALGPAGGAARPPEPEAYDLATRLRSTTEEMANFAAVPMDLWGRHSNAALDAAARITALEGVVLGMRKEESGLAQRVKAILADNMECCNNPTPRDIYAYDEHGNATDIIGQEPGDGCCGCPVERSAAAMLSEIDEALKQAGEAP